ncbi:MAG: hypothetical protein JNL42_13765, partial [Anaerolineae bacterium]|nr:hypothetical protein [Anaerolineae bacterium]
IGVLITLETPTAPMNSEAAAAGFFHSAVWSADFPKIQVLTIADLMAGKTPRLPNTPGMFRKSDRVVKHDEENGVLPGFE